MDINSYRLGWFSDGNRGDIRYVVNHWSYYVVRRAWNAQSIGSSEHGYGNI